MPAGVCWFGPRVVLLVLGLVGRAGAGGPGLPWVAATGAIKTLQYRGLGSPRKEEATCPPSSLRRILGDTAVLWGLVPPGPSLGGSVVVVDNARDDLLATGVWPWLEAGSDSLAVKSEHSH